MSRSLIDIKDYYLYDVTDVDWKFVSENILTEEQHTAMMRQVMARARRRNIRASKVERERHRALCYGGPK